MNQAETKITIHFICRGNVFRSVIAEVYLRSLGLKDVTVSSSGTVAERDRQSNLPKLERTLTVLKNHGLAQFIKSPKAVQLTQERLNGCDKVICMNRRAFDEAAQLCSLPADTTTWEVADIGEPGRPVATPGNDMPEREEGYIQISKKVDELVASLGLKRGE